MKLKKITLTVASLFLCGSVHANNNGKNGTCDVGENSKVSINKLANGSNSYSITTDGNVRFTNIVAPACNLERRKSGTYFFSLYGFNANYFTENNLEKNLVGHNLEEVATVFSRELGQYSISKDEFESWDDFWKRTSLATSNLKSKIDATVYAITFNNQNVAPPYITYQYDAENQWLSGQIDAIEYCQPRPTPEALARIEQVTDLVFANNPELTAICDAGTFYFGIASNPIADSDAFFRLPWTPVSKEKAKSLAENFSAILYGQPIQPYLLGHKPLIRAEGFYIYDFATGHIFLRKNLRPIDANSIPQVSN